MNQVNSSKEEKKSLPVFSKTKEDDKIVLQRVGFEISRERQGLLTQSRKMAKRMTNLLKNPLKLARNRVSRVS